MGNSQASKSNLKFCFPGSKSRSAPARQRGAALLMALSASMGFLLLIYASAQLSRNTSQQYQINRAMLGAIEKLQSNTMEMVRSSYMMAQSLPSGSTTCPTGFTYTTVTNAGGTTTIKFCLPAAPSVDTCSPALGTIPTGCYALGCDVVCFKAKNDWEDPSEKYSKSEVMTASNFRHNQEAKAIWITEAQAGSPVGNHVQAPVWNTTITYPIPAGYGNYAITCGTNSDCFEISICLKNTCTAAERVKQKIAFPKRNNFVPYAAGIYTIPTGTCQWVLNGFDQNSLGVCSSPNFGTTSGSVCPTAGAITTTTICQGAPSGNSYRNALFVCECGTGAVGGAPGTPGATTTVTISGGGGGNGGGVSGNNPVNDSAF